MRLATLLSKIRQAVLHYQKPLHVSTDRLNVVVVVDCVARLAHELVVSLVPIKLGKQTRNFTTLASKLWIASFEKRTELSSKSYVHCKMIKSQMRRVTKKKRKDPLEHCPQQQQQDSFPSLRARGR